MRKLFLNTILPMLFIGGLTVFGISIGNMYYGSLGNNMVYADSLDNPPEQVWFNVGGMFNERGFSTSNSFSYDENEIINNFNGNLQYSFPLYHFDGPGDLNFDLSLSYNGSLAHTLIAADPSQSTVAGGLPQHNFNIPGWILSANGVAVQTLNFETNFFTQQNGSSEAVDKNVNLHATGYQFTDRKNPENTFDYINLLMGDGSLLKLENFVNGAGTNLDTGDYYAVNRKDYTKAKVTYIENFPSGHSPCRNRKIELMRGDGVMFRFLERGVNYYDAPPEGMICYDSTQVIMLDGIIDRYGNEIQFYYDETIGLKGRRPLELITFSRWSECSDVNLSYASINNVGKVTISNSIKGNYEINTTGFNFDSLGSYSDHRAMVTSIQDPLGEVAFTFGYEGYTRQSDDLLYNSVDPSLFSTTLNSSYLKRLTSVTNKNGGERRYSYKGNTSLSLSMHTGGSFEGIRSDNDNFWGQGRDAFFNNLVEEVEYFDVGEGSPFKTVGFRYNFSDQGGNYASNPVDYNDNYTTTKSEVNQNTDINDSPSEIGAKYYYKNYPVADLALIMMENYDSPGETKLIKEEHTKGSSLTLVKTIDYFADITGPAGTPEVFNGSFLDTLVRETINGAVKESKNLYEFFSDYPFTGATFKNPIKKVTSIDPFKNKKITEYEKMDGVSKHYFWANFSENTNVFENKFFYLGLPKYEELYDSSNNLTGKSIYSYIWGNTTDSGYIGQLVSTKMLDPSNASIFKEIKNEYYKKDTVGKWLYQFTGIGKPAIEGNLKKITDAKGNVTNFYYHPVSPTEGTLLGTLQETDHFGLLPDTTDAMNDPPKVTYIKAYENGTDSISGAVWQDSRMPTRTDVFVSPTYSLTDYNKYTSNGNLLANVNSNRYLSMFEYDKMNRILHAAAPYDLAPFDRDTIIDTSIQYVAYDLPVVSVGSKEYIYGDQVYYFRSMSDPDTTEYWLGHFQTKFNISEVDDGGPPSSPTVTDSKRSALIGFDKNLLSEFITIDSAFFTIFPTNLIRMTGDPPDTSYNLLELKVNPLDTFTSTSLFTNEGSDSKFTLEGIPISIAACSTAFLEKEYNITDLLTEHMVTNERQFSGLRLGISYSNNYPDPPERQYALWLGQHVYQMPVAVFLSGHGEITMLQK